MEASTFMALAAACAPLIHPQTAEALVRIESAFNPHAIGVVGGSLQRQPTSRKEALATSAALRSRGRDFSVGLGQINVRNLDRLGMSLEEAFDPCANLQAMQLLLIDCFDRAWSPRTHPQQALRRAFSCYYSGNFSTGFKDGYVRRVVQAGSATAAKPVPPHPVAENP